jgi:hypothetical protein
MLWQFGPHFPLGKANPDGGNVSTATLAMAAT